MATAPTLFQKKQAARRATADIERLSKSYQSGIFDVAQAQQKGLTDWTAQTKAVMEPYEAAVKKYTQEDFPAYQSKLANYNDVMATYDQQVAAYRQRLDQYQSAIQDVANKPYDYLAIPRAVVERYSDDWRNNTSYYFKEFGKSLTPKQLQDMGYEISTNQYGTLGEAKKRRTVPTFTEEAPKSPADSMPVAPAAPEAPAAPPAFDTAQFEQKRQELASTFQREVGERKAAKQNVMMRRFGRGMLQGA